MSNKLIIDAMVARISGALAHAEALGQLQHQGTIGRLREIVLTDLIEPFLPPPWKVATGLIVDSRGEDLSHSGQSGQEDILIYSPELLPEFEQG